MKPEEIQALRKELRCTARELADALGVPAKTVMAWEQEEMFPTKQYVDAMTDLRATGSVPRKRSARSDLTPMQVLADPELWRVVRKLIAHADLRSRVQKLSESYSDPE